MWVQIETINSCAPIDHLLIHVCPLNCRSDDLFDLVWQGGARGSSMEVQPAAGHLPPPSPSNLALPPSDDEMAAWLYPIVRGDHPGVAGHAAAADDLQAAPNHKREKVDDQQVADHHKSEDKLPKTEEKCRAQVRTYACISFPKRTYSVCTCVYVYGCY